MHSKRYLPLLVIAMVFGHHQIFAQLIANAGNDTLVCMGSSLVLGGNPTAYGGAPPYSFRWSPATNLSSDTVANPIVQPVSSGWYQLTVKDGAGDSAVTAMMVTVGNLPVFNITADTGAGCDVQLHTIALPPVCGVGASAIGAITTAQIGSGTISQPGNGYTLPGLFGNLKSSTRQQILYTAGELQAALGGPQVVNGMAFKLAVFNSNAYLLNFTISMGCTGQDSLTDWQNDLQEVLFPFSFQPGSGWNQFAFNRSFYWDGVSNLVVDICYYDPSTFGHQLNKAECSNTAFSSYIYEAGNIDLCGADNNLVSSALRPNVKFSYTTPVTTGYTCLWGPATGPGAVSNAFISNPTASPQQTTTYYLTVTNSLGCSAKDSITLAGIQPSPPFAIATASNDSIHNGQVDTLTAIVTGGNGSYTYQWANNNTTPTIIVTQCGLYYVTVTDNHGCSVVATDTVYCLADTALSISANTNLNPYIQIFPNPAVEQLNIINELPGFKELKIVDLTGRQVWQQAIETNNAIINISNLAPGLYVINFVVPGRQYHQRFIKSK